MSSISVWAQFQSKHKCMWYFYLRWCARAFLRITVAHKRGYWAVAICIIFEFTKTYEAEKCGIIRSATCKAWISFLVVYTSVYVKNLYLLNKKTKRKENKIIGCFLKILIILKTRFGGGWGGVVFRDWNMGSCSKPTIVARKICTKYNTYTVFQDMMTNLKDVLNYKCRSLSLWNKQNCCW